MDPVQFQFHAPARLEFGEGVASRVSDTIINEGNRKILVVTGSGATASAPGLAAILKTLDSAGVGTIRFPEAMNDPETPVVDKGRLLFESEGCDAILAFGGGSPMDCAKGIAASVAEKRPIRDFMGTGLAFRAPTPPLYAVPTTAGSGSEVTNAAVFIKIEADGARKKMGVSGPGLFPRAAFVDPVLQAGMPPSLTAATGMDALTHAVEAYLSRFHTPAADVWCEKAIRLIGDNLRLAVARGSSMEARSGMALAATMAGVALSNAGLGMVHGIAHPVGALAGLAHGLANAIILPYVMRACMPEAEERLARIAFLLGAPGSGTGMDGVRALARLAAETGIPPNLREAGVPEAFIPQIIADALGYRRRPASPRALTDAEIGDTVREAWGGSIRF